MKDIKRRNLAADMNKLYEILAVRRKAKSAFKPTATRRTRKRAKSMEIQFAVSGKRSPWAKVPQAH